MIKKIKYLLTFIVISLGIINFSSSSYCGTYGSNGYNILTYTNTNTNFISNSEDSDYFRVSNNLNFLTDGTYNLLYHRYNGEGYSDGYGAVFWNNNKLYMYNANNIQNNALGYVDNFIVCGAFTGGTDACTFYDSCNLSSNSRITMSYSDFLADPNHGNADMVGMSFYYGSLQLFCLSYSTLDYSLCVSSQNYIGNIIQDTGYWVGNQSSINDYPFMSHLSYSPFVGSMTGNIEFNTGTDNIGSITPDVDNYIDQYEKSWNFNEQMCYVGTYNLSGLYEDGISFIKGTGNTIFGLYHYLYNSFGSNIIHNVGSFIDVWLINYSQWFDTNIEDRLYLATYNGPDTNISLIYTGFTFPFAGKSASIFFMSDLLYNEYNMNEPTFGENVSFYCYMKLNRDSIKNGTIDFTGVLDMVNPGIVGRIEDRIDSDLHSSPGFNIPDVSSGSVWDGIVNSGYNIPSDINPTNLFQDYYDKINNLIRNFSPVSNGVIPKWILFPMIFLILYRILKH